MKKSINYVCTECGTEKILSSDENVPKCCDKPMAIVEPLPVCELSSSAEHARMDADNEPCDDGRAGSGR